MVTEISEERTSIDTRIKSKNKKEYLKKEKKRGVGLYHNFVM